MKADLNTFYVYTHHRATDGAIFYVGKGTRGRAYKTHGRNLHWKRVVAKHGYYVTIVADGLTESDALSKEIALIAELGKTILCNMTDGGEGMSGHKHSIETKRKQSDSAKQVVRSEARLTKLKLINVGRTASSATKLKMSDARKGYAHPPEAIEKMRQKAASRSAETVARQVAANTGKIRSDESRANMAASQKGKAVACSNGMVFEKMLHAAKWLKENGHPKASVQSIIKASSAKHRVAYGLRWQLKEDCATQIPT